MNMLRREPVMAAVLVPLIVSLAARYGFNVPESDVLKLVEAGSSIVAALLARAFVSPVKS